jgi:hypothetical protein
LARNQNPYDGRDTFCAVRHPYTRAISQHKFLKGACNKEALNQRTQNVLRAINASLLQIKRTFPNIQPGMINKNQAALDDCHWLPQFLFVSNHSCAAIIHTESLEEETVELLRAYHTHVTPEQIQGHSEKVIDGCDLTVGDFDAVSLQMLQEVYKEDFHRLGYDPELSFTRTDERFRAAGPPGLGLPIQVNANDIVDSY